jgi:hypothetical protein
MFLVPFPQANIGVVPSVRFEPRLFSRYSYARPRFDSRQGQENFLYYKVSRQAHGLSELPIQWLMGTSPPGVKQPGHEADLYLVSRSRIVEF